MPLGPTLNITGSKNTPPVFFIPTLTLSILSVWATVYRMLYNPCSITRLLQNYEVEGDLRTPGALGQWVGVKGRGRRGVHQRVNILSFLMNRPVRPGRPPALAAPGPAPARAGRLLTAPSMGRPHFLSVMRNSKEGSGEGCPCSGRFFLAPVVVGSVVRRIIRRPPGEPQTEHCSGRAYISPLPLTRMG